MTHQNKVGITSDDLKQPEQFADKMRNPDDGSLPISCGYFITSGENIGQREEWYLGLDYGKTETRK